MLRQQTRMENNDVFDHILSNAQRVFRLSIQYENHPNVEESKKECNVASAFFHLFIYLFKSLFTVRINNSQS